VQKFALVKRLDERFKGQLSVIAINVDEKSREAAARQIIKDYGLKWPQVMSGSGEADPVWKTFGGMSGSSFAIPLYVLIDRDGKIVYAGSGGDDLSELIAALKLLLPGDGRGGAQP
jgi:peroxiredoxin